MKRFILLLLVILVCFYSFPSFATSYRSGRFGCADFEAEEQAYREQLNDPDPYVSVILVYAMCLLTRGEVTNNQDDVSKGMLILHNLDDHESNLVANYVLAEYYFSGGDFKSIADRTLKQAAHYYSRTLAIIKLHDNYPPLIYSKWEETDNIEMTAYRKLPSVYLEMFFRGVAGDYSIRQLESPSYKGDRDIETYPEYREGITGYIDLMIDNARSCKNLPLKSHFDQVSSPYYIQVCAMYEEKAKLLKEIQWKRHVLLSQDRCKDIGSEEVISANCPELTELDTELINIYESIHAERKEILYPIRDRLVK